MRLSLILAARPTNTLKGPFVRIPSGMWRVIREGIVNTVLCIETIDSPLSRNIAPHEDIIITGPTCISVQVLKAGSELEFNAFAEKIDGVDDSSTVPR